MANHTSPPISPGADLTAALARLRLPLRLDASGASTEDAAILDAAGRVVAEHVTEEDGGAIVAVLNAAPEREREIERLRGFVERVARGECDDSREEARRLLGRESDGR